MDTAQAGQMVIRTMGANVSCVESLVCKLNSQGKNHVCCHHVRVHDEDILTITYDNNVPKVWIDDLLRLCVEELDECIYAIGDSTLEQQLVTLLKIRGRTLSVAESFTGGGIARRITSVSGASEVYFEGINAYNTASKIKRLGVSPQTLAQYGAVSEKTAYEMAVGLLRTGDCNLAIATTGLAGPNTDESGLPVGLCYIAVGTLEKIRVYQYNFDGSRDEITEKGIDYALYLAYKQLRNL
jgi:nicotinamide-nucleotide amidase